MRRYLPIIGFLLFVSHIYGQSNLYDDTLIAASYGYSHSKNAQGANNREHTQEYAYKAMLAYKQVEKLTRKCQCPEINEMAYQAKNNAYQALRQDTYERSRFYAKRVRELGSQLLVRISECFSR